MAPLLVYVLVAVLCWIVPTRVGSVDDQILNVYPVRLLGLVSALLACVHWSFSLRSRFAFAVALCWAFATTSLATFFAASAVLETSAWELLVNVQGTAVAVSALLVLCLMTQLLRAREAPGAVGRPLDARNRLVPGSGFVRLARASLAGAPRALGNGVAGRGTRYGEILDGADLLLRHPRSWSSDASTA